jgi:hypothetical protein
MRLGDPLPIMFVDIRRTVMDIGERTRKYPYMFVFTSDKDSSNGESWSTDRVEQFGGEISRCLGSHHGPPSNVKQFSF